MEQLRIFVLMKRNLDKITDTIGMLSVTVIIGFSFLLPQIF